MLTVGHYGVVPVGVFEVFFLVNSCKVVGNNFLRFLCLLEIILLVISGLWFGRFVFFVSGESCE